MGLVLLKKTVDTSSLQTALEIGGGFGTVGEILNGARPDAFYADVDIPPVAAIATWYLEQVLGEDRVLGYEQTRDWDRIDLAEIARSHRAVVLRPWQLPHVEGQVDLFMNFVSFQEMEPQGRQQLHPTRSAARAELGATAQQPDRQTGCHGRAQDGRRRADDDRRHGRGIRPVRGTGARCSDLRPGEPEDRLSLRGHRMPTTQQRGPQSRDLSKSRSG